MIPFIQRAEADMLTVGKRMMFISYVCDDISFKSIWRVFYPGKILL